MMMELVATLPPELHCQLDQIRFVQSLVKNETKLAEQIYKFHGVYSDYIEIPDEVVDFYLGQCDAERRDRINSFIRPVRQSILRKEVQHWLFQLLSYGEALDRSYLPHLNGRETHRPVAYLGQVRGIALADQMARAYGLSLEMWDVEDIGRVEGWTQLVYQPPTPERDHLLALYVQASQLKTPFAEWTYTILLCWCPLWLLNLYGLPYVLERQ